MTRSILRRLAPREHSRLAKSGYRIAVAERIAQLNPELWDAATANASIFLSRQYLTTLENFLPANVEPRYALITDEGRPIAAVSCQLVTIDAEHLGKRRTASRAIARVIGSAKDRLKGMLRERVLVCGNLLSFGQHAVAFSEEGLRDRDRSWAAVAETLYRIRRAERLSGGSDMSLIKDVPTGSAAVPNPRGIGFRRVETEPEMVLAIDERWQTYDDYLAALDGKYRKSARQIVKEVAECGLVLERMDDLQDIAEDMHSLYLAVQDNNELRLVTSPTGYLPALVQAFGTDARCAVLRREGKLLGFVVTLKDRDTAVGYHIGFDRNAAKEAPIYLRLLHAVVEDAIQLKCRRLSLGRTALEPKARLGATPEPMEVWVKHRARGLNFLIGRLLAAQDHAEAPERNPFKKPPAQ